MRNGNNFGKFLSECSQGLQISDNPAFSLYQSVFVLQISVKRLSLSLEYPISSVTSALDFSTRLEISSLLYWFTPPLAFGILSRILFYLVEYFLKVHAMQIYDDGMTTELTTVDDN